MSTADGLPNVARSAVTDVLATLPALIPGVLSESSGRERTLTVLAAVPVTFLLIRRAELARATAASLQREDTVPARAA